MKKKLKRFWFNIRYRLLFDIQHGEGKFGVFYAAIGRRFNPVKPWYWRNVKPPMVELSGDYNRIVPLAYHTGDGWWLHWGAIYDGDGKTFYDKIFPEPLCDVVGINNKNDYSIDEWPFFIPYATSEDLVKAGFYYV